MIISDENLRKFWNFKEIDWFRSQKEDVKIVRGIRLRWGFECKCRVLDVKGIVSKRSVLDDVICDEMMKEIYIKSVIYGMR